MEHQRPDLNTLSPPLPNRTLIHKCRMRHPPRPSVHLAIITLDQHDLLGLLPVQKIPSMRIIRPHRQRLPLPVRIDQRHRHQVRVRDRVRVRDGERVARDRADGPPDVDDLVAGGEELRGEVGQVVWDAGAGGGVGLVDVDAVDGAAEGDGFGRCVWIIGWFVGGGGALVDFGAADGMVEDVDARCAGAVEVGWSVGGNLAKGAKSSRGGGVNRTYASFKSCSVSR